MKLLPFMLFALAFSSITDQLSCQVYLDGGRTRHRFAQLNLGLDQTYAPGSGSQTWTNAPGFPVVESTLPALWQSRLTIGGTHFWGHADLFLGIPLYRTPTEGSAPGVETGVRIYPWAIEKKKIRPFVGASWLPMQFQTGKGASLMWNDYPLLAGASWQTGNMIFDLGITRHLRSERDYFFEKDVSLPVRTQPWRISAGFKWILETTLSAEKDWQSGRTRILTDTLAKLGRLDGITVSAGPSIAILSGRSGHNSVHFPYLGQHRMSHVFPELGIGYYWHSKDLQLNVSFRPVRSKLEAFDHRQILSRTSLNLELYRFLLDFHGFAPFAGPSIGLEWLSLEDRFSGKASVRYQDTRIQPGLVFGWDIRPNRLQSIYLRTHLRWTPPLFLKGKEGDRIRFQSLEFNFIHAVIMIDRW